MFLFKVSYSGVQGGPALFFFFAFSEFCQIETYSTISQILFALAA